MEAHTNPNLTTWRNDFQQPFPKNSFLGQCLWGGGSFGFVFLLRLGLVVTFGSGSCLSFLLHLCIYVYNPVSGHVPSSQCFIYHPHLLSCL